MVTKLLNEGHEVVVWNRTREKAEKLRSQISQTGNQMRNDFAGSDRKVRTSFAVQNFKIADSVKDLVKQLNKPRIIWLMLPARSGLSPSGSKTGEATQEILNEVEKYVENGDIVIDGGNAHYPDTQRRWEHFSQKGIKFLGIGVSGGVIAAVEGYPLMAGGDRSAYEAIKPILDSLAKPKGGHEYFGQGGAGHFVKMVHNGIEYGVMQSIGEGFGVLEKSPYDLDLLKVARLYQKNTLNSGFMMQRTIEALEKDPKLEKIEGYIDSSGEGEWTIEEAKKLDVPVDIIEESFKFRQKSQKDKKTKSGFDATKGGPAPASHQWITFNRCNYPTRNSDP